MSEPIQIDSMLRLIENPVRRKIIKRLSQEPSYPLELAKEIGEAQQLVTSHLALLERAGLVSSSLGSSPVGPNRRSFFLKDSVYISVSFGPHLFNEQFFSFEALPKHLSDQATNFMHRISDIKKCEDSNKLEPLSCLIQDIDGKLSELEGEKTVLLFIRNLAMKHASEEVESQHENHQERRMMHYLLDEGSINVQEISEALNMKESIVKSLLKKLEAEIMPYQRREHTQHE